MVILAQMGSFVPAISAEIGIVDRLFSYLTLQILGKLESDSYRLEGSLVG